MIDYGDVSKHVTKDNYKLINLLLAGNVPDIRRSVMFEIQLIQRLIAYKTKISTLDIVVYDCRTNTKEEDGILKEVSLEFLARAFDYNIGLKFLMSVQEEKGTNIGKTKLLTVKPYECDIVLTNRNDSNDQLTFTVNKDEVLISMVFITYSRGSKNNEELASTTEMLLGYFKRKAREMKEQIEIK